MTSTVKRIPKRSIIGSRVCVQCSDKMWRHGTVLNIRPGQTFSVKLEHSNQVTEHVETSILGPGFLSSLPPSVQLCPGQHVYLTHNGREVEGCVTAHHHQQDCVQVDIGESGGVINKKLEDIRLLESRKSARLVNSDTDFSLLADFNIVEQRKLAQEIVTNVQSPSFMSRRRLHSMSDFHDRKRQKNAGDQERREAKRRQRSERLTYKGGSVSIDVPGAGVSMTGSRKRRTSESRAENDSGYGSSFGSGFFKTNEENLKECTAAMVLMNLSVSPRDKWLDPASYLASSADGFSDLSSPPPTTPRPSPAPSLSHIHLSEDEEPFKRSRPSQRDIQYQCTWRGCGKVELCQMVMEKHVRGHLGLPDPPPGTDYGGEEDFYYTEIEPEDTSLMMDLEHASDSGCSSASNDGMEFGIKFQKTQSITTKPQSVSQQAPESFVKILPSPVTTLASSVPANFGSSDPLGDHIGMARPSYEAPTTIYVVNTVNQKQNKDNIYNSWQGKKLVSIIPRPESVTISQQSETESTPFVFKSTQQGIVKSDKKCRKVYGIDQKDLWCTQCKWKKACGRFT